jgi:hypothetical protein
MASPLARDFFTGLLGWVPTGIEGGGDVVSFCSR